MYKYEKNTWSSKNDFIYSRKNYPKLNVRVLNVKALNIDLGVWIF